MTRRSEWIANAITALVIAGTLLLMWAASHLPSGVP